MSAVVFTKLHVNPYPLNFSFLHIWTKLDPTNLPGASAGKLVKRRNA